MGLTSTDQSQSGFVYGLGMIVAQVIYTVLLPCYRCYYNHCCCYYSCLSLFV